MSFSRPHSPITYEHYRTLSASTDERYELIDGDLYMVPASSLSHQAISMNVVRRFDRHARETNRGRVFHAPLDVVLGDGEKRSVVQPDIVFISNERKEIMTEDKVVGAPDVVVEILSSGTAGRDRGAKKALYARCGVREYWVVDPELETVEVFSPGANEFEPVRYSQGDTVVSTVLPGFEMLVGDVFDDLP